MGSRRSRDGLSRRVVRQPRTAPPLPARLRERSARLAGQGPRQGRRLAHDGLAHGGLLLEDDRRPARAVARRGRCRLLHGSFYRCRRLLRAVPSSFFAGRQLDCWRPLIDVNTPNRICMRSYVLCTKLLFDLSRRTYICVRFVFISTVLSPCMYRKRFFNKYV
uniref:Uncharacterized protein n=1 Tax=Zea mays TaxID=4577 RepID=A0A804R1N9_MAIZE